MSTPRSIVNVPEQADRLVVLAGTDASNIDLVADFLRDDRVVLISNVSAPAADVTMAKVAEVFGLRDNLEIQAGFAAVRRHRERVGRYYMTVAKRAGYQFITPHSEGSRFTNMQLASFYCYENSTDGGETILLNVNAESSAWRTLREKVVRAQVGSRALTRGEVTQARLLYGLDPAKDALQRSDTVLQQRETQIGGLQLLDVLALPTVVHSRLLERNFYVFWDAVAGIDHAGLEQFAALLRECGLFKEQPAGAEISAYDPSWHRRVWNSGTTFEQLFDRKVTIKLTAGDFIIHNNLTWAHSVSNWSPQSGVRNVTAAFA